MEERPLKRVSDSHTEQVQIIMNSHLNGDGRVFGGQLVEWIDTVAVVTARRHAGCGVTTASIDQLQFRQPGYVGDTVVLVGEVTYVGRTSMEVRVRTFVEKLSGRRKLINEAYLLMVAVREGHPVPVPGLILETEEQQRAWQEGQRRSQLRRQLRQPSSD
ncbi:MAG: acyl-CoA thioesterase [Eubacteriales bacterium]|jgi:acyl-CoA hydrolase